MVTVTARRERLSVSEQGEERRREGERERERETHLGKWALGKPTVDARYCPSTSPSRPWTPSDCAVYQT